MTPKTYHFAYRQGGEPQALWIDGAVVDSENGARPLHPALYGRLRRPRRAVPLPPLRGGGEVPFLPVADPGKGCL